VSDNRELMRDQYWRLNNLYWIVDKKGQRVKFVMKPTQDRLYHEMWYNNIILKSRQHGYTTFIDLFGLDSSIFNSDYKFGIIAHNLDDAGVIFRDKIKFPYDNLPDALKAKVIAKTDRAGEFVFSNGSSIRVSTSYRSGTLQLLHVSEYGKISIKYPDKAKEIKTGAFEAVGQGSMIFVESTAEGREGEFFDLCDRSQKKKKEGTELSVMDFKFFFAPWFDEQEYRTNPKSVHISQALNDYFDKLESEHGIFLDEYQKAWYAAKDGTLQDDMKQEHPSTPEEAFEASVEGAYFANEMKDIREKGRLTNVPHDSGLEVNTFWDLGHNDTTAIWFHQQDGRLNVLIDYLEASGETIGYYARRLKEKAIKYGYVYGTHFMPHDSKVTELFGDGRKRIEVAEGLGIKPVVGIPRAKGPEEKQDDIETTRIFLHNCFIDKTKCGKRDVSGRYKGGIAALDQYRKEWDESKGMFKATPLHNWASNGADALRTGAVGLKLAKPDIYVDEADLYPEAVNDY